MTAKSPAQRKRSSRAQLKAQGLCEHRVTCYEEHKARITEYAAQLRREHESPFHTCEKCGHIVRALNSYNGLICSHCYWPL